MKVGLPGFEDQALIIAIDQDILDKGCWIGQEKAGARKGSQGMRTARENMRKRSELWRDLMGSSITRGLQYPNMWLRVGHQLERPPKPQLSMGLI